MGEGVWARVAVMVVVGVVGGVLAVLLLRAEVHRRLTEPPSPHPSPALNQGPAPARQVGNIEKLTRQPQSSGGVAGGAGQVAADSGRPPPDTWGATRGNFLHDVLATIARKLTSVTGVDNPGGGEDAGSTRDGHGSRHSRRATPRLVIRDNHTRSRLWSGGGRRLRHPAGKQHHRDHASRPQVVPLPPPRPFPTLTLSRINSSSMDNAEVSQSGEDGSRGAGPEVRRPRQPGPLPGEALWGTIHPSTPPWSPTDGEAATSVSLEEVVVLASAAAVVVTLALVGCGAWCCFRCARRCHLHQVPHWTLSGLGACEACLPDISYQVHVSRAPSRPSPTPVPRSKRRPPLYALLSNLPPGAATLDRDPKMPHLFTPFGSEDDLVHSASEDELCHSVEEDMEDDDSLSLLAYPAAPQHLLHPCLGGPRDPLRAASPPRRSRSLDCVSV